MRRILLMTVAVLLTTVAVRPTGAQSSPTVLTNADIVHYVGLGLPDQVVKNLISDAKKAGLDRFDLSASGVASLATRGVSPSVIAAMRQPSAPPPASAGVTHSPSLSITEAPMPPTIPIVPLVNQIIGSSGLHRTMYTLAFQYSDNQPKTIDQLQADIRQIAAGGVPVKPDEKVLYAYGRQAAFAFIAAYSDVLTKTFARLYGPKFLYGEDEAPVVVGLDRGQVAVVLTGVVHDSVFNVNRTTARERAADVVRSLVFTDFAEFGPLSRLPNIGFVGIEAVYGSKTFGVNPAVSGLMGEAVTVVIPSKACQQFIAGEMSEDDLLKVADVYLLDRDTPLDARKVMLSLH